MLLHDQLLEEDLGLNWIQSFLLQPSDFGDSTGRHFRAEDAALELYSAWKNRKDDPEQAVSIFLRAKGPLAAVDYLMSHRLARRLESELRILVKTPSGSFHEPLLLVWPSLSHLKNSYLRDYFEQGESWDAIEVQIEAIPIS